MVSQKQPRTISRTSEVDSQYKWGFVTDIEEDRAPKGLNEDIVRLISRKKEEPEWMSTMQLGQAVPWMEPRPVMRGGWMPSRFPRRRRWPGPPV
jgi:hypothetical protein